MNATLRQAALMLAPGLAGGALLSVWASDALGGVLFRIDRYDPLSFAVVAALLALVGIAAVLPPARRAAKTDPMLILRGD